MKAHSFNESAVFTAFKTLQRYLGHKKTTETGENMGLVILKWK